MSKKHLDENVGSVTKPSNPTTHFSLVSSLPSNLYLLYVNKVDTDHTSQ